MRVAHVIAIVSVASLLADCSGGSGTGTTTGTTLPPTNGNNGGGSVATAPIKVTITEIPAPAAPVVMAVSETGLLYFGSPFVGPGLYLYNGTTFINTVSPADPGCGLDPGTECPQGNVDAIDAFGLPKVLWATTYLNSFQTFAPNTLEYGGSGGTSAAPPNSILPPAGACCYPFFVMSLVTAHDGKVWIGGNSGPNQLEPLGDPVGDFTKYGVGSLLFTNGPNNNIWGAIGDGEPDTKVALFEFSQTGSVLRTFALPTGTRIAGISSDRATAVWFTDEGQNAIGRITTQGTLTEYPIPTPSSDPRGISVAADGSAWFTEFNTSKVGRVDTTGRITEFRLPTPNTEPQAIAANPPGCNLPNVVWVGETGSVHKIAKLTYH